MEEIVIGKGELGLTVQRLLDDDCRLATAVCQDVGDHFLVAYYFHKGLDLVAVRIEVGKDESLPSISGLHLAAALIENEMKEFFGINITDIAIDFQGRMLLAEESPQTPLLKK
ncbi:MAG: NADH-quinone oxidoreductase subunit C [Candidatus Desulforudis sp.]|nr:NADH-quinone oxidoreductase subunit C [Desulforudis sp.]